MPGRRRCAWAGDPFWRWDEAALPADAAERRPAHVPLFLYHATRTRASPWRTLDMHARALPQAVARRLAGRDHQLGEEKGEIAGDIVGTGSPAQ